MAPQLNYGNWIRKKKLLILGLGTLGVAALIFIPLGTFYRLVVAILFAVVLVSFLFPLYAYVAFSQHGGRFQEKVYNLIIQSMGKATGKILDIGSGNGVLAIKLAQQNDQAEVVGIDYWGEDWEYSKNACEKNAEWGGVAQRVRFQKGDAAKLEFADNTFDGAVSNLTFHEVRSITDKKLVVQEALRVVKPGGTFAFVDYFYEAKHYGTVSELEGFLKGLHLTQYDCIPLRKVMTVPVLLRHPKALGKVGIISGKK